MKEGQSISNQFHKYFCADKKATIPVRTFRLSGGPQPTRPGRQATTDTVYSVLGDRSDIKQERGEAPARAVHNPMLDLGPSAFAS